MINEMILILKTKVNIPILDRDFLRLPSYGVYISQLIRFARICSYVIVLSPKTVNAKRGVPIVFLVVNPGCRKVKGGPHL